MSGRARPLQGPAPLDADLHAWTIVVTWVAPTRIGLSHVMIDFRRDDLGRMLELLDLGTRIIRPAVDNA